jgi:hypothetical protein
MCEQPFGGGEHEIAESIRRTTSFDSSGGPIDQSLGKARGAGELETVFIVRSDTYVHPLSSKGVQAAELAVK